MGTIYNIIIYPIELLIEMVFSAVRVLNGGSVGTAIVLVSFLVNLALLPFYRRADEIQLKQEEKMRSIRYFETHIKKTFQGNEKMMMLSTLYREMNYHPVHALKGSVSLLLQVPFFVAAYHFLTNLQLLNGARFLAIRDLGTEDGLLSIGSLGSLNLLPIIMTLLNLIAGAIYSRDSSLRSKAQIYGMALVFLFLLYHSPSGLVLYWTCNNLFSLLRNVANLIPQRDNKPDDPAGEGKEAYPLFLVSGILLVLTIGSLIPLGVIAASPAEFVDMNAYQSPLRHVVFTTCVAIGFLLWMHVFYYLIRPGARKNAGGCVFTLSVVALMNHLYFDKDLGIMSPALIYDRIPVFQIRDKIVNASIVIAVMVLLFILQKKWKQFSFRSIVVLCVGVVIVCLARFIQIESQLSDVTKMIKNQTANTEQKEEIILRLDKRQKNVVVIMLDRAFGPLVPYFFYEREDIRKAFDGFTWYPNTISFGAYTNYGAPPLFGGYEYTPSEMNKRDTELLKDKHNEALKLMPTLFSEAGYESILCDLPYANYQVPSDYSIFDEIDRVNTYRTEGAYVEELRVLDAAAEEGTINRNFFCHSIFRVVPTALKGAIYNAERYLQADVSDLIIHRRFLASYSFLRAMCELTEAVDRGTGSFIMIDNETPHNYVTLQLPDHTLSMQTDNDPYQASWKSKIASFDGGGC